MNVQKRLASQVLKCSPKKVWIDPSQLSEVKEAITKADIKSLILQGSIRRKPDTGVSRARAKAIRIQKRKGKRRGVGSRKGTRTARLPQKIMWMSKVRIQRSFLRELKEKKLIEPTAYRELYRKSGGGFFRSKRHIKIYLSEHSLVKKK